MSDEHSTRVAAARMGLREALEGFDGRAIGIVRLTNAIEDMIDARITAIEHMRALSEPKSQNP